jgi:hypothetical protein
MFDDENETILIDQLKIGDLISRRRPPWSGNVFLIMRFYKVMIPKTENYFWCVDILNCVTRDRLVGNTLAFINANYYVCA